MPDQAPEPMNPRVAQRIQEAAEQLVDFAHRLSDFADRMAANPTEVSRHLALLPTIRDQLKFWAETIDRLHPLLDGSWRNHPLQP